jgi:putative hydrolase of the HAD superfamily
MTTSMGQAFGAFCAETGVDPERFKAVISEAYGGGGDSGTLARLERGQVALEEFERWLAARLSDGLDRPIDPTGLKDRLFSGLLPDTRMVEAVARARRQGISTALVSNSWGSTGYERGRFPELFDEVVVSGETGLRKPEPEIYLHTARLLGVPADECVFVDDLEQNVEGARAVGMTAFVHRSAQFTIPRLEELFAQAAGEESSERGIDRPS